MFNFFKGKITSIYNQITSKLKGLFNLKTVDNDALKELEKILINSDTGVNATRNIIDKLKKKIQDNTIKEGQDLKEALEQELIDLLQAKEYNTNSDIFLLVGINGSGKTTFAGKLSYYLKNKNKKVLLVAADTFRAAAVEQLSQWSSKLNIDLVKGNSNQDPSSVVYLGIEKFKSGGYDKLIIDTAGRLQTKSNLMKELAKIRRTITKGLPNKKISTLLTIDAMLGQNSFNQAEIFNESTNVDGIVLTKLDGTGKGGIVFSITKQLGIPIAFISYGEKEDQLSIFDPKQYVKDLL